MFNIPRSYICHGLAAMFSAVVIAPLVFSALDRDPPFRLLSGETIPQAIERGSEYRIKWIKLDLPKICPGTVYRVIYDGDGVVWTMAPVPSVFSQVRDSVFVSSAIGYPNVMPSGAGLSGPGKTQAKISTWTIFECNWFQHPWLFPLRFDWPDIQITILESTKP